METSEGFAGKIEGLGKMIGIERVYGKPEQIGDKTVIPVAAVSWSGGGGFGKGEEPKGKDSSGGQRSGQGGGGGGKVYMRPVALLEISADQTRVVPIVDRTRIILAGMLLVGWNFFWLTYTVRRIVRKWR